MKFLDSVRYVKTSLINFYKNWNDGKDRSLSNGDKLKYSLALVFVSLIVVVPYSFLLYALEELGLIDLSNHKVEELFDEFSYGQMLLFGVLIAPALEEVVFRALITFRRFYPLLIYIHFKADRRNKKVILSRVLKLWDKVFPVIIICSSLLFGFVHITNFEGEFEWWLVPFLVLPQIILGFGFAFARVKYGLVWSVICHSTYNFILLNLSYLLPIE